MKNVKNYLLMLCLGFAFIGFSQDNNADEIQPKTEVSADQPAASTDAESKTAESNTEKDVSAQPDPTPGNAFGDIPDKITDLISSMSWYDFLFILGFNLLGYLSPFIPVLRKIGDTEVRIGVAAIVVIMIFASMNVNAAWKLVIEFILSTKLYELVFSKIKRTDKATAPSVAIVNN